MIRERGHPAVSARVYYVSFIRSFPPYPPREKNVGVGLDLIQHVGAMSCDEDLDTEFSGQEPEHPPEFGLCGGMEKAFRLFDYNNRSNLVLWRCSGLDPVGLQDGHKNVRAVLGAAAPLIQRNIHAAILQVDSQRHSTGRV